MNWSSVASNQAFSFNTLQNAVSNGYFTAKSAIPASSRIITVQNAQDYVYIQPIDKPTYRLVVKSDLVAIPGTSTWTGAAVSDSGQYQTVINTSTGYLWESSDYGASWTQNTSAGSKGWRNLSISQTGAYRVAVTDANAFVSTNGGSTYTALFSGSSSFVGTAISDAGQYQWITLYGGYVYRSDNYGSSFIAQTSLGVGSWQYPSVASAGQYVLIPDSAYTFGLKRSSDYGVTWSSTNVNTAFEMSAMSDSGQYQITAQSNGGGVSVSSNYGVSWTNVTLGTGVRKNLYSGAMYASGEFMLVADNYNPTPGSGENGYVWRSTDFGATWNKITSLGQANWQGVGFGNNYALATASNHVYRSTDYGATWTQVL